MFEPVQDAHGTTKRKKPVEPLRLRIVLPVIKASGLLPMSGTFIVLLALTAVAINYVEPHINSFLDALWLLFAVVTTIGFGDLTCTTIVGRVLTVLISIYSVFYLALVTGTVVSYCQERLKYQRDESIASFIYQLEHLPELSHEELVELSEKVREPVARVR